MVVWSGGSLAVQISTVPEEHSVLDENFKLKVFFFSRIFPVEVFHCICCVPETQSRKVKISGKHLLVT